MKKALTQRAFFQWYAFLSVLQPIQVLDSDNRFVAPLHNTSLTKHYASQVVRKSCLRTKVLPCIIIICNYRYFVNW